MVKSLTIGLVDDGVATWNPVSDGNLLVTGGAGCGKTWWLTHTLIPGLNEMGQRAHPLLYGGRQRFHAGGRARGDRPKHRPVDPRPYERVKERIMKNIFVLNSVIRLIERNTAHAIRFAQAGAALLLIAAGTLVFGACVPLTGIPLVVLVAAFVICSFIGSQLFGGAILVMEEDQRKRPTQRDER